jgi:hypothetical protein
MTSMDQNFLFPGIETNANGISKPGQTPNRLAVAPAAVAAKASDIQNPRPKGALVWGEPTGSQRGLTKKEKEEL